MTKKEKVTIILELLHEHYGPTKCYLDHENAWQLLIATMLSAQCTDARVNLVTKDLFKKYTSVKDFAQADLAELEQDIHSTGFYHNKAKNIIACCQKLLQDYNGEVPSDIEQLTALAGVGIAHGRKICIARRPKCQECFLLPYCTGGKALEKEKKKKEKKA